MCINTILCLRELEQRMFDSDGPLDELCFRFSELMELCHLYGEHERFGRQIVNCKILRKNKIVI